MARQPLRPLPLPKHWRRRVGSAAVHAIALARVDVAGITVHPDEMRMDIEIRKIPAGIMTQPGNPSVGVVAGTRYSTRQTDLLKTTVTLGGQVIAGRWAA